MGCCGQKRAALRTRTVAPSRPQPVTPPPEPIPEVFSDGHSTVVEYGGDRPILVIVPSGRLYTFSPGRRSAAVPPADAGELLRNPLFRLHERRANGTRQEGS
jgi:hypothetical protein